MSLNTNTLPTASDLSSEKRSICLINDSFPPVIDGVANAVTNYASVIQRSYGDATVVTPYYPDADDSIYPFPVLRYPSIDTTKLVGYRAGLPLSPELMAQVEGRHIDLIHSHCPVTSTILARMLRQRLHVPLVFTYHTKFDIDIANAIHSKRLQEASIKLLVENISACDEVWTVSRGAGENLRSLGYQGDYIVMPNGVDIPSGRLPEETVRAVSEGLDLPEGVPLLLFAWCSSVRAPMERPSVPMPRNCVWATRYSFCRPAMTGKLSEHGIAAPTCSCFPPRLIPTVLWCVRRRPAALPAC